MTDHDPKRTTVLPSVPSGPTDPTLRVDVIRAGHDLAWNRFVDAHDLGTLFHRTPWRDLVVDAFGFRPHYLQAQDASGTLCGVLPLFEVPRPWGKRCLISVPFAVYGGVLGDTDRTQRALLEHAARLARQCDAQYLELRHREPRGLDDLPGSDLYITYIRDLPDRPEACLGLLPRKARAAARHARERHGLVGVSTLDLLDTFHPLFLENKRQLGSPAFAASFFRRVAEAHEGQVGLFNVLSEGRPVSAVLYFVYRDTIYPYFSGTGPGAESVHANNFMYMALMEHAVRLGLKRFDFGRSRKGTGSARFKEHQGFTATNLDYRYQLYRARAIPSNNPSNPRYDRIKRVWAHTPPCLARLLGPRLIRYFP